jgi:hypothetical protein
MKPSKTLPLLAGATATALMVLSAPALADTPLAFDTVHSYCSQTAGGSHGAFECSIGWSGGTGAVTATFVAANQYTYGIHVSDTSAGYLTGSCVTGHGAAITATLTDSVGASLSRNFATSCARLDP